MRRRCHKLTGLPCSRCVQHASSLRCRQQRNRSDPSGRRRCSTTRPPRNARGRSDPAGRKRAPRRPPLLRPRSPSRRTKGRATPSCHPREPLCRRRCRDARAAPSSSTCRSFLSRRRCAPSDTLAKRAPHRPRRACSKNERSEPPRAKEVRRGRRQGRCCRASAHRRSGWSRLNPRRGLCRAPQAGRPTHRRVRRRARVHARWKVPKSLALKDRPSDRGRSKAKSARQV